MLSRGLRRLSRTLERRLVRSPLYVVANLIGRRNAHRANMVQLECTAATAGGTNHRLRRRPRCSAAFQTKGSGLQYTAAAALLRPYPRQAIASPSAQWIEPPAVRRIVRAKRDQAKFGRVPFQAKAMFVLGEGDGQDPEIWHDLSELSECDG